MTIGKAANYRLALSCPGVIVGVQNQRGWGKTGNFIPARHKLTLPLFFDNLPTSLIEGVSIGRQVPEMSF
jgi:hypothetical protein